jgi:hypothetical protein
MTTELGKEITVSRIRRDIELIKQGAKRIKRQVDKVYAHTERDRRKIGRPIRLVEIDAAIKTLIETYKRYALLIQGSEDMDLVPEKWFDIMSELKKIWP